MLDKPVTSVADQAFCVTQKAALLLATTLLVHHLVAALSEVWSVGGKVVVVGQGFRAVVLAVLAVLVVMPGMVAMVKQGQALRILEKLMMERAAVLGAAALAPPQQEAAAAVVA